MSLDFELRLLALHDKPLLRDLRISVPNGVAHTVMGPSGCGKSSLLAAVCGTLAPPFTLDAQVLVDGQAVDHLPTQARRIGMLFQDDLLFAHMTVRENLLFAVPPGPQAQREAAVRQALVDLELPDFAQADPATLSGGQRTRVALMRALLAQPRALLLDEPFARLDAALRGRMRDFVFGLLRTRGIPALLVTHDADDVADLAHLTRL
ncbi:MAG: ATP-binding cassette domain-containing protein [Comamonadaceae bacterium]|nr:MAG: ATP-binding cassette domain-containing protein [Comamonadaceae bacterium]